MIKEYDSTSVSVWEGQDGYRCGTKNQNPCAYYITGRVFCKIDGFWSLRRQTNKQPIKFKSCRAKSQSRTQNRRVSWPVGERPERLG